MAKTGKDPRNKTSARAVRDGQRRAEMLHLRIQGLTLEQIGDRLDVTKGTVSRVISTALAAHTREPAEELLALELGRCDVLLNEAMTTVKSYHPMVSGGCVVVGPMLDHTGEPVRHPETGEVLTRVLEDKAPKLAAIATAVRVMERRAKLLGLDTAIKLQQEVTVTQQSPAPDMTGLDDHDLCLYGYLIEKMTDSSASAGHRNIRDEVRGKLTLAELGTLQEIFRRLDVPYLAADVVQGLYSTPPSPALPELCEREGGQ